eukprot:XP_002320219.2 auxin-responsive protein SAUR32 [Populus trichocarpa]
MANVPRSLTYSSPALFNQAVTADPWPSSFVLDIIMGSGEKSLRNFHLHLPHLHHHKKQARDVPKGCLAIKVGQGEEQQRFVVPVIYFNHPLFIQLLKEAEEEYGFDQKGTISIPCHVEEFRNVQGMIDREKSIHHHHLVGCFRA